MLVTSTKLKANTLPEFIALAKATPARLNYSSAGIGSVAHLVFAVFMAGAGIDAVHVPYKGGGQAIADVAAGHIDAVMSAIPVARGLIAQGQVKGLAVTSSERSPVLPELPTLRWAEGGVTTADVDLAFWWGPFGPAGMPEAVKGKLSAAFAKALTTPQLRERLAKDRHRADLCAGAGAADEACPRDRQLDEVHRRPWHQGGVRRLNPLRRRRVRLRPYFPIAAVISFTPSGLAHSAGPAR